jgi:hypothetical protein
MSKIKNPVRFSDYFKVDQQVMNDEGLFDPILNVDTRLFIDPLLLEKSSKEIISKDAKQQYKKYFENVLKLLKRSRIKGDEAWKAARTLLTIREVQGTSLGYGVGGTNGRNLPKITIDAIVNTAKEIVDIGIEDPELFALLPLIQDGIGPDFISDFTTSIIEEQLIKLTMNFAVRNGLTLIEFNHRQLGKINCLQNPFFNIPILLAPKDILGKLPTASDWAGVREAADFSDSLRRRVNKFISNIWAKRAEYDKEKFKKELIENRDEFIDLIGLIKSLTPISYNFEKDEKGLVFWHDWLNKAASEYPLTLRNIDNTKAELITLVETIITQFKFLIENRGLNKLLWNGDKRSP